MADPKTDALRGLLAGLYEPDDRDRRVFGLHYRPPSIFEHGVEHEIVLLPARSKDGQDVVITESRFPARFYKIHIAASDTKPAAVISTGSGTEMALLALRIAEAIADGMLGVRPQ
jgi:hypothetical protein